MNRNRGLSPITVPITVPQPSPPTRRRCAGRALTLETGGDLALLAAQSQSASRIDASGRDSRKATTLKYSDEETRQLLTTLAAGTALTLAVGGDFTADVGEKNADGTLRADRMTADGIVKGDSRQQVSVTRTGVGADSSLTSSQVRGDLASQGIRNGANGDDRRGGCGVDRRGDGRCIPYCIPYWVRS